MLPLPNFVGRVGRDEVVTVANAGVDAELRREGQDRKWRHLVAEALSLPHMGGTPESSY